MNDEVLALLNVEVASRNLTHALKKYPQDLLLHQNCYTRLKVALGKVDIVRESEFDNDASLQEFIDKGSCSDGS